MAETLWELRYRSPLAPSKGVDDIIISTDTDDEQQARKVADDFLATKVAHPSTRFISLRLFVAHSEKAMRARLTAGPSPLTPAEQQKLEKDQRARVGA